MSNHPRASVPGRPKRQETPHAAATFGVLTELEGSRPTGPGTPWNIVAAPAAGRVLGSRSTSHRPVAADDRKRLSRGHDAMVLRLLEEREPTLIRMRTKESWQLLRLGALGGGEEPNGRPNHRVREAENVHSGDAIADVRMCAGQIIQNPVAPVSPIARRELSSGLLGRQLRERVIVRPHRAILKRPQ